MNFQHVYVWICCRTLPKASFPGPPERDDLVFARLEAIFRREGQCGVREHFSLQGRHQPPRCQQRQLTLPGNCVHHPALEDAERDAVVVSLYLEGLSISSHRKEQRRPPSQSPDLVGLSLRSSEDLWNVYVPTTMSRNHVFDLFSFPSAEAEVISIPAPL
jgi:hypothetical protein